MQGKQVIRSFFRQSGVRHIFQLPGLHTLGLIAELFFDENIKIITPRHEANCAFMADGYARSTGKPAVVVVTPGPGLGNIVSGCMESFSDDIPLLILHIDIDRKDLGRGILHEIHTPEDIFRHFTKAVFVPDSPEFIHNALEEAWVTCMSGRPGPVLVSIPFNFLDKSICSPMPGPAFETKFNESDVTAFGGSLDAILRGKEKPVIIGGQHCMNSGCGTLIEDICSCNIPFLTSTSGKGIVSDRQMFSFGNMIAKGISRTILGDADIVIAAGTRLRDVDSKRRGIKIPNLVHIDIDDRWINKNYRAAASFTGQIETALQCVLDVVRGRSFAWDLPGLKDTQNAENYSRKESAAGYRFVDCIRSSIPDNANIVCDLNIPSYWAEYYLPVYSQRSFFMPRGISTIFYSLCAAIGVKIGRPDVPCLALCGDGSFLPQAAELATIMACHIPLVILIDNNNSYSILEDAMRTRYDIKGSMDLKNPDFVKLAHSFGIKAKAVDSVEYLGEVLSRDVRWDEPYLIEYKDTVSSPPWNY